MDTPEATDVANWYTGGSPAWSPWYTCELHYSVAIVVCYRRILSSGATEAATTATIIGGGVGGGDVTFNSPLDLKEGNWIALCGGSPVVCRWYRVVTVGDTPPGSTTQYVTLSGPDCTDWASRGSLRRPCRWKAARPKWSACTRRRWRWTRTCCGEKAG